MTRVAINGVEHELARPSVVAALAVLDCSPSRPGIAVAVNGDIVPRSEWADRPLRDGDEVEVVSAAQGG